MPNGKPQRKPRTKQWWLWYGTLAWGIPFFIFMAGFYLDPRIHAAGLLVFMFTLSLLGGFCWGFRMWKFCEAKRQPDTD
jgi:hypothetical protein